MRQRYLFDKHDVARVLRIIAGSAQITRRSHVGCRNQLKYNMGRAGYTLDTPRVYGALGNVHRVKLRRGGKVVGNLLLEYYEKYNGVTLFVCPDRSVGV